MSTTNDQSSNGVFRSITNRLMNSTTIRSTSSKIHHSQSEPTDLKHLSKDVQNSLSSPTTTDTVGLEFNFDSTYTKLRDLTESNCQYFAKQNTDVSQRFERLLTELLRSVDLTMPLIRYLSDNFHHFDYSSEIHANGYRTLVVAHGQACLRTLDVLQQIDTKRAGLFFNLVYSPKLYQELNSWTKALDAMERILRLAVKMVDYSGKKTLYVRQKISNLTIESLFRLFIDRC